MGEPKLWRISHIKHVFRLFCLIPHCDVIDNVNTYENKEKLSVLFLKYIFGFIRQRQWKLTGKWERDPGTPAHPAVSKLLTGSTNKVKSVPHLCPKETSMGVNKQKCPNEDTENGTRFFPVCQTSDLFLHVTRFISTEIFPPQCYFFQELVTLEFSYGAEARPFTRALEHSLFQSNFNNVRKMRGERFLLDGFMFVMLHWPPHAECVCVSVCVQSYSWS